MEVFTEVRLDKHYNPNDLEPTVYALWEQTKSFAPSGKGEPFGIIMPPPNANGNLHAGHALTVALEDIMARYYRMQGRDVAYIPGADHAGFETWVVFEKELAKNNSSRHDFSREELYKQVWDFVEQQRGNMELQLRALGISASWQDLVFTLDPKVVKTVYSTFKKLWDEGLIYRDERIVNYSTAYQTSYADIEVEHRKEKGTLYEIAYPVLDKIGEIVVSTTRPETMFGDVAVAVHPDDERYKNFIGSTLLLPLTKREIPVIADSYVDMTFGTGAVKITPAHDPNDFEIGKRHKLNRIQVIDFSGVMINTPDQFLGLKPEEARKKVLLALQAEELIRGEKTIEHSVGYDYKSGLPIQPLVKDQWFLKIRPLAERAKQAILNEEITFTPKSKSKLIVQYLDNLHDWNLSRQIPWGIPIPAFQSNDDPNKWIFDERVNEKTIVVDNTTYTREEDTFDTWFSSGQWPFITTDYLDGGDLARFYPNSVMETGADILDRWVARMIMLGLYVTEQVPFKHVYLHGLIMDEKGAKMSKSKGNVINPMELIAKYGSDALRIGVVLNRSPGQNQAFNTSNVVAGRNFANKLWNITRFIESKIPESFQPDTPEPQTIADHWIIGELGEASRKISGYMESYRFAEATETMYHSIWNLVADWYIEASKYNPNPSLLAWVLDTSLKLAHPFAPFVTEALWQALPWKQNSLLITSSWPTIPEYNQISHQEFNRLIEFVTEVRFAVGGLPKKQRYQLLYESDSLINDNKDLIKSLTQLNDVVFTESPRGLKIACAGREAWIDIDEKTLDEHKVNLEVRIAKTKQEIENLTKRLDNKSYIEKAPKELVEETKNNLESARKLLVDLLNELEIAKID